MIENSSVSGKPEINVSMPERVLSVIGGLLVGSYVAKNKNFNLPLLSAGLYLFYRGLTGHCTLYSAFNKEKLANPVRNINARTSIIVGRSRDEVYEFWRNVENLPLFMNHLESVKSIDSKTSHWKAKIPGGTVEWYAEIVKDIPNEMIGWNSLPGASIVNAGKVTFEDVGGGATKVSVVITYRAPLGIVGNAVSRLFNPSFEKLVHEDIKAFQKYMELQGLQEKNLL